MIENSNTYEIIKNRRSIRSYKNTPVPEDILLKCVDAGRLAPTARNAQPLEFIIIDNNLDKIFSMIGWAGSVSWKPKVSEMPRAYIAILYRKDITCWNLSMDVGITAENIVLCAESFGVSSCILGAFNKVEMSKLLGIPETHEFQLLISLGYRNQESIAVDTEDELKYCCDDNGNFKIPKRKLNDVLHRNIF